MRQKMVYQKMSAGFVMAGMKKFLRLNLEPKKKKKFLKKLKIKKNLYIYIYNLIIIFLVI